jgi:polysaccharide deacetylase family protein (PEP-CTERM system associated)
VVQEVKSYKTSAFTVDVEDGVSIAMRDVFGKTVPQTNRVIENTQKILDLLAARKVKGTFFILGQVAKAFPDLVKSIANAGHEIGVHGYDHWQFFKMTPEQAKDELSTAKKLLEDLTGKTIQGHRAPAFSVSRETAWALDVIAECGFTYDSSIVPGNGARYGWPGFTKNMVKLSTLSGNQLIEVPISTTRMLGKDIPFSGGGYLRLFPFAFTKRAFQKHTKNRPVIHYMHPYELDTVPYPDYYFEEMKKVGKLKALKMRSMWINRSTILPKLDQLLKELPFGPMNQIISEAQENGKIEEASIHQFNPEYKD